MIYAYNKAAGSTSGDMLRRAAAFDVEINRVLICYVVFAASCPTRCEWTKLESSKFLRDMQALKWLRLRLPPTKRDAVFVRCSRTFVVQESCVGSRKYSQYGPTQKFPT